MASHFFGLLSRMRLIQRWSLMRSLHPENVAEHSYEVAVLAHHLAWLRRLRFSQANVCPDPHQVMAYALFHDAAEIMTGDLPTPVKYADPQMRSAFKRIEDEANARLVNLLPRDLQPVYEALLRPDRNDPMVEEALRLVKAADKLAAWLKCEQEVRQGNQEFLMARQTLWEALEALDMPEVQVFVTEFAPSYGLPLDALKSEFPHA